MKREIKFRGIKNSTKEWIYGSLLTCDDGGYAIVQIRHNPISNGVVSGWCFGIDKGTECQYTGLKDKNGKDIYEGDILSICNGSINCFPWMEKNREVKFSKGSFNVPTWDYDSTHWIEVIGNIYENP